MIKTTRWSPDTCKCVMEYEWDDTTTEDQRVHTFSRVVQHCSEHEGLKADRDHYDHVCHENQTKNRVHAELLKNPKLTHTKKNDRGEDVTELLPGIEYEWSFTGKDHARELSVNVKGASLTAQEKNKLTQIEGIAKTVRVR